MKSSNKSSIKCQRGGRTKGKRGRSQEVKATADVKAQISSENSGVPLSPTETRPRTPEGGCKSGAGRGKRPSVTSPQKGRHGRSMGQLQNHCEALVMTDSPNVPSYNLRNKVPAPDSRVLSPRGTPRRSCSLLALWPRHSSTPAGSPRPQSRQSASETKGRVPNLRKRKLFGTSTVSSGDALSRRGRGRPAKSAPPGETNRSREKGKKKKNAPPPAKRSRRSAAPQPTPPRARTRFQPQDLQEPDQVSGLSSDLSMELVLQADPTQQQQQQQEEEEEEEDLDDDDDELPSFLERKPSSISPGMCVWCKYRKYPYWPAVVKRVNHKNKKASVVFVDSFLSDSKRRLKGLTVSLKTLKPFDSDAADTLKEQAKEEYGKAIIWSLELIQDYRIRIGCGSFSGSFLEYFTDGISGPLRRDNSQETSDLNFPGRHIPDELFNTTQEEGFNTPQEKKLLPDRSLAARTRANKKLVEFIVKKRGAERRLLGVISGQAASKWLRALQKASRSMRAVMVYLEEEEQQDQVFSYLEGLLDASAQNVSRLLGLDNIRFITDVLFPEALICAIAGVDNISLQKAEEKYQKGPCLSNREQQEFDMRIEQRMKVAPEPPANEN
uniref:PWWP domain-containing protein n=1 Tax=Denticeps clupeoides TaxID=299321 RepID=A0AAY3ZWB8_9TELE